MHTLIGCFIIVNEQIENCVENIGGKPYRRIELKLSQQFKRVFYVETEKEFQDWFKFVKKTIGQRTVTDLYDKGELLGQGSFGKVYLGSLKTNPKEKVAIKYIDKKQMKGLEISLQMNEIEILKVLGNHPNIIRMHDYFEDAHNFYMVLEYLEGKDLFNFISQNKMEEKHISYMFKQLLMGLKYMHEVLGVVHRDIKLENIMMSGETMNDFLAGGARPKFIDFGLSKTLIPGERSTDPFGTLIYCSPEVILGAPHTKNTDIWSIGIVLYALLTDRMPFVTFDKRETSKNIVQQRINFNQSCWMKVTNIAKDLISRLLEKNQEIRIGMNEILQHQWFTMYDERDVGGPRVEAPALPSRKQNPQPSLMMAEGVPQVQSRIFVETDQQKKYKPPANMPVLGNFTGNAPQVGAGKNGGRFQGTK